MTPKPQEDPDQSDGPTAAEMRRELARVHRAIMLAPTIEICEALLRGERVPITLLDPVWVAKFGLREK